MQKKSFSKKLKINTIKKMFNLPFKKKKHFLIAKFNTLKINLVREKSPREKVEMKLSTIISPRQF